MSFAIYGTETNTIKTVLCYARINVFNVSFLDSTINVNKKKLILGIKCKFSLNHSYQYSYCSQ